MGLSRVAQRAGARQEVRLCGSPAPVQDHSQGLVWGLLGRAGEPAECLLKWLWAAGYLAELSSLSTCRTKNVTLHPTTAHRWEGRAPPCPGPHRASQTPLYFCSHPWALLPLPFHCSTSVLLSVCLLRVRPTEVKLQCISRRPGKATDTVS